MALGSADGVSGLMDFGDKAEFIITGDLSFGMWCMWSSTTNTGGMLAACEGGAGESEAENAMLFLLLSGVNNSWDIRYIHEYNSGTNEDHTFLTNLANDTWHHVVVVRDDTAGTVKLYIDSVLFDTWSYGNSPTYTGSTADYFHCRRKDGGSSPVDAHRYAESVLANVAWTPEEVKNLYAGKVPYRGLIHYAPMYKDGTDLSGNANNGTVGSLFERDHCPVGRNNPAPFYSTLITLGAAPTPLTILDGRIMSVIG